MVRITGAEKLQNTRSRLLHGKRQQFLSECGKEGAWNVEGKRRKAVTKGKGEGRGKKVFNDRRWNREANYKAEYGW